MSNIDSFEAYVGISFKVSNKSFYLSGYVCFSITYPHPYSI